MSGLYTLNNSVLSEPLQTKLRSALWPEESGIPTFFKVNPTLAHYTSLANLEKILSSNEIWFSHPLLMNDHEEVGFGISHGTAAFLSNLELEAALGSSERTKRFREDFQGIVESWSRTHLYDTYVFCLTRHHHDDGLLSMWRGYGDNGNGAAIIFNAGGVTQNPDSPLIIEPVEYRSTEDRIAWLKSLVGIITAFVKDNPVSDQQLGHVASYAFERLKMAAIFSKHSGFREEDEWRAVYVSERDMKEHLKPYCSWHNGPRGIEPKFKFEAKPVADFSAPDLSMQKLIKAVILGPNRNTPLAFAATRRMLDRLGYENTPVFTSSIPFRPST